MAIQTDVLFQVTKGVCSVVDIAKALNLETMQVYSAGDVLVKKKQLTKIGAGRKSVYALPVEETVTEQVPVPETPTPATEDTLTSSTIEKQPVVDFIESLLPSEKLTPDYNLLFESFIENIVKKTKDEIELRVRLIMEQQCVDLSREYADVVKTQTNQLIEASQQKAQSLIATTPQPPFEPQKTEQRIRLPKVCVTGLKPNQMGILSSEFHATFDMHFWCGHNGDSIQQLKDVSKNCEVVFWHTKHANHSAEEVALNAGANLIRVGGDLSMMRKALTKYYQEKYATKTA